MSNKHNGSKAITRSKADNRLVVIDFGHRAVISQNFSKLVALPKPALANCGRDVRRVNVQLVQAGAQKFLKLTPVEGVE